MSAKLTKRNLPCTPEEYEQFRRIYDNFCELMREIERYNSPDYTNKLQKLAMRMEAFWPHLEKICKDLNISLKTSLPSVVTRGFLTHHLLTKDKEPVPIYYDYNNPRSIDWPMCEKALSQLRAGEKPNTKPPDGKSGSGEWFKLTGEPVDELGWIQKIMNEVATDLEEVFGTGHHDEQPADTMQPSDKAGETKKQEYKKISAEDWSNPMTKSAMMSRVGIDGYKKFKTFANQHGLRQAGNRQLWQIRLDKMDKNTKHNFEKT
jgi:hypothetical protein